MRLLAPFVRPFALCFALSSTVGLMQGCVPLLIGGAAATTGIVAVDRRTVGQQVEDKTIEIKVANSIRTKFGGRFTGALHKCMSKSAKLRFTGS